MSTTTTTTKASRPACFSKRDWDNMTFDAYKGVVALVKGEITGTQFVKRNQNLFKKCNIPADGIHLIRLITTMNSFTTVNHEKVCKVKSIGLLRSFFNGGWVEKDSLPVVSDSKAHGYKASAKKSSSTGSKKGPTKSDLEAQNAELKKQLEELKSKLAA